MVAVFAVVVVAVAKAECFIRFLLLRFRHAIVENLKDGD